MNCMYRHVFEVLQECSEPELVLKDQFEVIY